MSAIAITIAEAATRSAIEGSSFGKNLLDAIPGAIGQVLGGAIGDALNRMLAGTRSARALDQAKADPKAGTSRTALADANLPVALLKPGADLDTIGALNLDADTAANGGSNIIGNDVVVTARCAVQSWKSPSATRSAKPRMSTKVVTDSRYAIPLVGADQGLMRSAIWDVLAGHAQRSVTGNCTTIGSGR